MTSLAENSPKIFIGSSTKGKPIAEALQEGLSEVYEVELWGQGAFRLMQSNINSLIEAGQHFDYAILVLTPDDEMIVNAVTNPSPRDNVIFEIGFFLGALGQERTFIVYDNNANLKIPTDLAGVSFATYRPSPNLTSALGPACTKIKNAIKDIEARIEEENKVTKLVLSALKVASSALTIPLSFDISKIRAFIFKLEGNELVCRHFWTPPQIQTREEVGLSFKMDSETAKQVAVVQAARNKRVVGVSVSPLAEDLDGVQGEVEEDICFILAAPILGPNGEVWGTVDLDTSSPEGEKLLKQPLSKNVIFELGKHLYMALTQKGNK